MYTLGFLFCFVFFFGFVLFFFLFVCLFCLFVCFLVLFFVCLFVCFSGSRRKYYVTYTMYYFFGISTLVECAIFGKISFFYLFIYFFKSETANYTAPSQIYF